MARAFHIVVTDRLERHGTFWSTQKVLSSGATLRFARPHIHMLVGHITISPATSVGYTAYKEVQHVTHSLLGLNSPIPPFLAVQFKDMAYTEAQPTIEEQEDSTVIQRPPHARTIMDMKDRSLAAFQPFITFDFEPDLPARVRIKENSSGRRLSPVSSRVAISHFDPEGVEHLRNRLSSASEYSSLVDENRSGKASLGVGLQDDKTEQLVVEFDMLPEHPRNDMLKFQQTTSSSISLSSLKPNGLYADKRLSPFDLETALRETIKRHGAPNSLPRTLGLGFKDLSVFGTDRSLSSQTVYQPTLWSTLNPVEWTRRLLRMRKRSPVRIVSGFEGVVNPGEMLLVLGRPGSGCSTLLKVLANQTDGFVHVLGDRCYDTLTPRDVRGTYRGDVLYCPESTNAHIPSLTVQQTISFAAKTQRHSKSLRSNDLEQMTTALMTIFGLRHTKDMLIGGPNDIEVSQAEKRRVSICEALAARALISCWNNSSKGLAASAALEFARALRIATDLSAMTTIVSLSQVGETLYQLFDKVCVVGEGQMYYYGRADAARDYFVDLGYNPLQRQATADFLISVTDPLGRIKNPKRPLSAPRTPEEFARAFHRSPMGRENRFEVANYWQDNVHRGTYSGKRTGSVLQGGTEGSVFRQSDFASWMGQLLAVASRRQQILKNNWILVMVQILLSAFQGVVTGLTYWHSPDSTASFTFHGSMFFIVLLFSVLSPVFEGVYVGTHRSITLRHYSAGLYRPSTEALAIALFDIPITLLAQSIFGAAIYALTGLRESAGHFLIFLLFVVSTALTMRIFFRLLMVSVPEKAAGYAIAGLSAVLFLLHSGFVDSKSSMSRFLRWLAWLDPLRYSFEGLMVNEYHNRTVPCATFAPHGTSYDGASLSNQVCLATGSIPGQRNVNGDQYFELAYGYSYSNLWINLGFVLVFGMTFLGCFLLFSEWNTPEIMLAFVLFKRGAREHQSKGDPPDTYRHIRHVHKSPDNNRHSDQFEVPLNDVFAWRNLQYAVPRHKGQKVLLDGVSGYVAPRKLCALVGECGVGKTTLLNVLAGRSGDGIVTGELHLNGLPLPPDFQSQIGYCQQADMHYSKQTVREALRFSAELRQSTTTPHQEKEEYVESCLKMCGLEAYADAMVCTLNIENRRRTTIGVELAAQPKLLLFLDEPTSGLDSQAALAIIALLRDLANHGQAIICAIHQPSCEVFQHFDQLLLLRKEGKMVYFGDIGHDCKTITNYFERNGARPCNATENPAEWMMHIVSADDNVYIPIDWHDKWLRSPEVANLRREIQELQRKYQQSTTSVNEKPPFITSWLHQTHTLLKRGFLTYWRSPRYLLAKLLLNVLSGLLIGFTFFGSDNSLQGMQNKVFAAFMLTIICIPIAGQLQILFIDARRVYQVRERHSHMYSWTAFLASHLIVELLWNVFSSILLFSAWYWAAGFETNRMAYSLLMIGFLCPLNYTTLALVFTSVSRSADVSSLHFCVSFSFVGIFDGVIRPFEHLRWWKWVYRASPFTYLLEGFIGQALGHQQVECSPAEFSVLVPPAGQSCIDYLATYIGNSGGYVNNPDGSELCQYCPARTTDEYLASRYNIFYAHRWRNAYIVLVASAFNLLLLYTLTYVFWIRRGRLFCFGRRKEATRP